MVGLTETSRLAKALGDETRLRLLHLLRREELSVSELVEILNVAQSRISAHLALLKEVGLVADRKLGRKSLYKVVECERAELAARVLREGAGAPEFDADDAGLEALKERRREESRSYFDRVAATFGEQILPGRTWEGLARALLRLPPSGRYVDLGIGDGLLTLMLAEVADSVTAVDISTEMLDQLQQRANRAGIDNVRLVEGELDSLPLPDADFDVAVMSQALHYADDPSQALAEAYRILEPGGQLLVLELLAHNEEWVRDKLQHRHLGFTEAQLRDLIAGAGFEDLVLQRAARDPHPPHFMTLLATARRPVSD